MGVDGNKASGPDIFPFNFLQTFWSDLEENVFFMFDHFFYTAAFDHRISSSFFFLAPKVGRLSNFHDFRLISFLG